MNSQALKEKVDAFLQQCRDEVQRAAKIGKKMFDASKANSSLRSLYSDLGELVARTPREAWGQNAAIGELLAAIKTCQEELDRINQEMQEIKTKKTDHQQN